MQSVEAAYRGARPGAWLKTPKRGAVGKARVPVDAVRPGIRQLVSKMSSGPSKFEMLATTRLATGANRFTAASLT